jgi:glycosyltransferase involved in cell wall biosynthesis
VLPPHTRSTVPNVSVVVTCTHDVAALESCLTTFAPCCTAAGAEVIVVGALDTARLATVGRSFPDLTYVQAPPGTSPATLRRIGFLRASANILAFVDDCSPERHGWTSQLCLGWRQWADTGGRLGASCEPSTEPRRPLLSVVMPVRNGSRTLLQALEALTLSDLPRESWELVVVDDGSRDDTATIAAQYADRLVRLPGRGNGPGYARNRGFELTLGHYVTFINADVIVEHDTLRCSAQALAEAPDVGAVFGVHSASALQRGLVSQYRNLLLHYYLQRNTGDAATFSSGCGTMRSAVFEQAGGYDEWHFRRRQLEDLELGQRIRRLGCRIVLHPDIHATHLKRWTLRTMIATEIFDRGVPWMRLVRRHLFRTRDARRLRRIKTVNVALTWASVALLLAAWLTDLPALLLGAAGCLATVVVNNAAQLRFFQRQRSVPFALATIGLDLVYYLTSGLAVVLGWIARHTLGEPRPDASAEAFAEMEVRRWPPVPVKRLMDHPPIALPPLTAGAPSRPARATPPAVIRLAIATQWDDASGASAMEPLPPA